MSLEGSSEGETVGPESEPEAVGTEEPEVGAGDGVYPVAFGKEGRG